ncbi:fatty acid amide hydrolase isoform X1 [Punica granatum]|uniref:Fatty acid amide hydrolase isoform X1 n=1 Tax=Punica granatum TaxID=22663 RepID=A0A6P8CNZ1_PUNGR|nr:fatty acid amide hydrolase isoform X1 [Punica granatum]XP_031381922.1 fatty acid amide hydrolase isoform X1 [Punica granatum]XP_031381923.1 fatty acid amide hydrolase isoform X1 [Punica granatum]
MGKKRVMLPAKDVDLSAVKYEPEVIQAPHLTGLVLKLFIKIIEAPVIGPAIISYLKKQNKMVETLRNTVIPEAPMFKPEFPPQDPEPGTFLLEEDGKPEERVETALKCLPEYNPADSLNSELTEFRYWKIRDFAYAYRSSLVTPSMVAERIIAVIEDFNNEKPPAPLLITFDAEEVRKQAVASTKRFEEGRPLSTLDGIFVAIKDDIGLYPFIAKGATTWMDEVRSTNADAVSVSRLRSCGVIFVGKANMHELGMGTTGNNPNYGTTRNPHALDRYTGGSSSGPAAIVASGLCSAALGTDGGGSIRIPSSLCGVVGLKTTYGRTDMTGSLCDSGTVEIIGPIASSVEDVMLVYAAILGASPADRISLRPAPPCLPNLAASEIGSLRLGKYTGWFNDVHTTDISDKCEDILNQLTKTYGCEVVEIVIPELHEMRTAHLVSIGSETMASLNPDCEDGKGTRLTYDTRISMALFRSFSASDYVASQCLRRRVMHHHMEIFKKVDFIVTPTTGMTAPKIPTSALKYGETDMQVTGYLMRFILAGNLLGLPAVSVPVGYDKQGLPIGLQLIGRPWGEASLLRLASAVEELSAGSKKRPASFYDVLKTN